MNSEPPSGWERKPLGEVMTLKRGYDLPARLRRKGPVPVVSSSGISGSHSTAKVEAPGVVTGRYGTIGEVFYIDVDFWPLNTALYVQDFKGNDPRYCAELLRTVNFFAYDAKSGVPGINRNDLHAAEVIVAPRSEQARIAGVFAALDDKIQSNDRTGRRTEAVAATFFTWTIRSERAETTSVQELIDRGALLIGDGFRAKNSELGPDGLPFARAGNLQDGFDFTGADRLPESRALTVRSKCSAPGDVVFTSKGTVGRFALVDVGTEPFVYSPQLCFWRSLDHERLPPAVLFSWMQSPEALRQIDALKGQTDMADYVSLRDQRSMVISLPGPEVVRRLTQALDPLAAMGGRLRSESRTLRALRNTLLPRLISGEIRVPDTSDPAETIGALAGAPA